MMVHGSWFTINGSCVPIPADAPTRSLSRSFSKYRLEEHDMLNWLKANRKKMNAGDLKEDRISLRNSWLKLRRIKGRIIFNKGSF